MDVDNEELVPFGAMRLAGGRYDEAAGIPVTAAVELERYARLVAAVARGLFLAHHPERKRLPNGFESAFDLRLMGVEAGSVMPAIVRKKVIDEALFQDFDWHKSALQLITRALSRLDDGQGLPTEFPQAALKEFAQLGRSLREDERIELASSHKNPEWASLTTVTRKRIQEFADFDELEIETVVAGQLIGLKDSTPPQVTVLPVDSQRALDGTFSDAAMWGVLHPYHNNKEQAPYVAISVVVAQDRNAQMVRINDVLGVELALPPKWKERLEQLGDLEAGWLHPGSQPPASEVTELTEQILLAVLDSEVGAPVIYPSGEGGIQLEWRTDERAVEIEVLNTGVTRGAWYGRGDDEDGEEVVFEPRVLESIATFLQETLGG